jgi:hypothetical protein
MALQSALATNRQYSNETAKYINNAVTTYNLLAKNPKASNPNPFTNVDNKFLNDYLKKNKIIGPLPQIKHLKENNYELISNGKAIVFEIDPIIGLLRINGRTLLFKSRNGFQGRLEEVNNFFQESKTTFNNESKQIWVKSLDAIFSIIISTATADCLSKISSEEKTTLLQRDNSYADYLYTTNTKNRNLVGVAILAFILCPPAVFPVAFAAMFGYELVLKKESSDYSSAINKYDRLVSIERTLAFAKEGDLASDQAKDTNNNRKAFYFSYGYYKGLLEKMGKKPLSQEEFKIALADADSRELFCSPQTLDSLDDIIKKMNTPISVDPNKINDSMQPITYIVDEPRKDVPKPLEVIGEDKKVDTSNALQK